MKPNNLIALLVVVILIAIGIALAVINQHKEEKALHPAPEKVSFTTPFVSPIAKGASIHS